MIDIRNFQSNLLKIDKNNITMKTFNDCDHIHSVNPLYLIIHSATRYFKEKNGEKYLIISMSKKYEVFSGILSEIKTINDGKELFYEKNYAKIGINTDDDLPLNKSLTFPTLAIIIRRVFQEGKKLYPQIFLDECLYHL